MNMTSANMTLTADDVVFLVDVIQKLTRFPPTARIRNIVSSHYVQYMQPNYPVSLVIAHFFDSVEINLSIARTLTTYSSDF